MAASYYLDKFNVSLVRRLGLGLLTVAVVPWWETSAHCRLAATVVGESTAAEPAIELVQCGPRACQFRVQKFSSGSSNSSSNSSLDVWVKYSEIFPPTLNSLTGFRDPFFLPTILAKWTLFFFQKYCKRLPCLLEQTGRMSQSKEKRRMFIIGLY